MLDVIERIVAVFGFEISIIDIPGDRNEKIREAARRIFGLDRLVLSEGTDRQSRKLMSPKPATAHQS